MSLFKAAIYQLLPDWQQYPLPPKLITSKVLSRMGLTERIKTPTRVELATTAGHFGYGALGGALYGGIAPHLPHHPIIKGISFGLIFWFLSYLGWIPLAGVIRPATQNPRERNILMITAHFIYGTITALVTEQ